MQNFDFNSLYGSSAVPQSSGAPTFHRPSPQDYGQMQSKPSKGVNQSKKKNFVFTMVLAVAVVSFTVGLVMGIKIGAKDPNNGRMVDPQASSLIKKKFQQPMTTTNISNEGRKAYPPLNGKKVFVKIFPKVSASKAQRIAQELLGNKLPVYYSKLADGSYYLYLGPYKSYISGEKILHSLQRNDWPNRFGLHFRLVRKKWVKP